MFDQTYNNFHTNFDTAAIDICSNLMQQNANNPTLSLSLSFLCVIEKGSPELNDKGGENFNNWGHARGFLSINTFSELRIRKVFIWIRIHTIGYGSGSCLFYQRLSRCQLIP
jgi:hypothetical protein